MRLVAFIVHVLLLAQDDVAKQARDLVEKLHSEQVGEREAAAQKLADLGSGVQTELDRALRDTDPEVRGRVKQVIEEIARRKRILAVRPAPRRLTLELKDTTIPEAIEKILTPFGLQGKVCTDNLEKRRVSIRLKDSTLWEALAALRTNADIGIDPGTFNTNEWGFEQVTPSSQGRPYFDFGDVRVVLDMEFRSARRMRVSVSVALPVGSSPYAGTVVEARLLDDQGRDIVLERDSDEHLGPSEGERFILPCRDPGQLSHDTIWEHWISRDALKGAKTISFKGKVVLKYPHDVARVEFDVADPKAPLAKTFDDLKITIKDYRVTPKRASFSWDFEELVKGKRRTALYWVENADGEWLGDYGAWMHDMDSPYGKSVTGTGIELPEGCKPGKVVFAQFIGEDKIVFPFAFKDVPIPNGP